MFFCLLYSKKNGVHFVYKSTCEMLLIMTKDLGGMKNLVLTNVWSFFVFKDLNLGVKGEVEITLLFKIQMLFCAFMIIFIVLCYKALLIMFQLIKIKVVYTR
jgi:hypothetical protein